MMRAPISPGIVGTALLGALIALGADASELRAQDAGAELDGRLVSEEGGDPVEGALVRLLDQESRSVVADLTSSDGRFMFDRLAARTYRVQIRRLGYGEWTSEPFRIEEGARLTRTFRVPVRPVELPELRVQQKGECPTDAEEARRALELYEKARPALRAIAKFERSGRYSFVVELVRQDFVGEAGQARFETYRDTSIVRIPRPIASLEPEELLRDGYARPDTSRRSYARYFQPDARALASEEFVMSHCLSLAEPTEGDSLGVAFTPLPGRQVVAVRGVLWLEAETHAPLSADYRYTELEDFMRDYDMPMLRAFYREKYWEHPEVRVQYSRIQVPDHERLGGTIEFRAIRDGLRATVSWMQRVPVLVHSGLFGADIGAEVHPRATSWEHSCRVLALAPAGGGDP